MKKAVLLLSGGPDSTVLAYWIKSQGYELNSLTFNFGEKEGEAEKRTAAYFANKISQSHKFISFENVLKEFYMSIDDPIHIFRKGQYPTDKIQAFGAGVGISLAASYAAELGANHLFYAVHKDDNVYRENNKEFFNLMSKAISIELGKEFQIHTPFLDKTKADVFNIGLDLGVPLEETWSCASNSTIHCGWCEPCKDRKQAFENIGMKDNTLYEQLINSQTVKN